MHNAASSGAITPAQKADPVFQPTPQYWVLEENVELPDGINWALGFRDIARATDVRTTIASIVPKSAFGNKLPLILPERGTLELYRENAAIWVASLNSLVLDFAARSKIPSTSMNWYIVEQLPVIPPERFTTTRFGSKTAAEIIREAVLELTYTAHDMAPFARDMGYVDDTGAVKPPFIWNEARRLKLRAKLDAVFFHLYGITARDDIRYIYSTFPIVERHEKADYGSYRSRELCLAYMSALEAGEPDAEIAL